MAAHRGRGGVGGVGVNINANGRYYWLIAPVPMRAPLIHAGRIVLNVCQVRQKVAGIRRRWCLLRPRAAARNEDSPDTARVMTPWACALSPVFGVLREC